MRKKKLQFLNCYWNETRLWNVGCCFLSLVVHTALTWIIVWCNKWSLICFVHLYQVLFLITRPYTRIDVPANALFFQSKITLICDQAAIYGHVKIERFNFTVSFVLAINQKSRIYKVALILLNILVNQK